MGQETQGRASVTGRWQSPSRPPIYGHPAPFYSTHVPNRNGRNPLIIKKSGTVYSTQKTGDSCSGKSGAPGRQDMLPIAKILD